MKSREPVAVSGAVLVVAQSVIALCVAFGLDLTAEQQGAIYSLTSAVTVLVASIWARARVTPVD